MLKKIDGKWAIVSKKSNKPLAYYKGTGKPDEEWVKEQEKRIQYFKNKKESKMKTFKELMEAIRKWSDVKDRNVKKDASKFLKALDKGQVLGYSVQHDEFSIFDTPRDFKTAQKDKSMKWIVVEGKAHYKKLVEKI